MKLDLQHNDLNQIPRCLLELPSLGELNLAHNCLKEIPDVVEWSPCLSVLDLSFNNISKLPDNVIAPIMRALDLSYNNLARVPLCICSFTTLRNLNLSYNPDILQLPPEMGRLSQLSQLQLDGLKDLNDPPKAFLTKTSNCIHYLDSKLRCAKGFYKMKLMLVGQANRGKTTLVARLQGKDCGNESTVGVDVGEWSYKPSLGKNKFFFSIWDFGGQEEYYATHQCFLSERSLYLLLFNLKHGEKGAQELKPWLNNIALRAPNSLVIIVGTHLDQVKDQEREKVDEILVSASKVAQAFTHKLNIAQILPVGLRGRIENVGLLKDAIYNQAASYKHRNKGLPIMGRKIPASYHALDKKIESVQEEIRQGKRDPIMTSEQFKAMVLEQNLPDLHSDEELKAATLFLSDVGSLLHYDDRSHNLKDLYFVDPRWLCDMMSKVVTIRERNPFIRNGILRSKDVPFLFREERFPWEHFEQYLTLLDRFEIALPLDNKRMLVPSMLPVTSPEEDDVGSEPLYTRYIIFPKANTPPGFWSRLLSRMMHMVQKVTIALDKTHITNDELLNDSIDTSSIEISKSQDDELSASATQTDSSQSLKTDDSQLPKSYQSLPATSLKPPLTLPHFPARLPISLQDSFTNEDITLQYWREGLLYKDPGLFFRIESFESFKKKENGDGVVLRASPTNEGKQIIGQLVDIVLSLIQEWYPGINNTHSSSGVEQRVPCIECMKLKREKPHNFLVDVCLKAIANSETSVECTYSLNPAENHIVSLTDVVPDLLLQDIDLKFLLKEENLVYNETDLLGKGGFGMVYRGKHFNKPVAIKKYISSKEAAFPELRREAKLLQQSYHPCFVCLEGVCVYPMMALVLELAPLGALSHHLLKKKIPIHRLTIFRIALEVAAALRFVHKQGIVFRDLKADNILLWTLNPDSLCHCKITDFGIATHLSPVGVKGLKGTKGFTAPEMLYIDTGKNHSGYDHKADTFSYAMLLYQMIARKHPYQDIPIQRIDTYIENGERPKLSDVHVAYFAFPYLTKLMTTCWRDNPKSRPDDDIILSKLCQLPMQCTMAVAPIKSSLSLRRAIAITPDDFAEAEVVSKSSQLWVCCDGPDGSEVNLFNMHTMSKVKKYAVEDNQVHSVIKSCGHVWIGFRAGIECSVINIFSLQAKELVHNIRMRDISVSCMACTGEAVYIGTVEGYCFQFPSEIGQVRSVEKPDHKYISKNTIDGLACTHNCVWASHGRSIYFISFHGFNHLGKLQRSGSKANVGQLSLSTDGKIVWSAHLNGGKLLTAWNAIDKCHSFDVDTSKHLATVSRDIPTTDSFMTAMVPAEDCVWVGMATGHIMVFHEKELLTWFHPYTEYVRFLTVIPSSGPCEMEECMVASGGKGFQCMIEDLDQPATVKDDEKVQVPLEDYDGKEGCIVLWEAFSAKMYKQMIMIEKNTPKMFENHESISKIIVDGDFVDGTNILNSEADVMESGDTHMVRYKPDVSAQNFSDFDRTSSNKSEPEILKSNSSTSSSRDLTPQSEDNSELPSDYQSKTKFRQRLPTIVSKSKTTDEVFEIQLLSTKETFRITCPSPPQLSVVMTKLLADATVSEENSKLFYMTDQGKELQISKQEQFKKYLGMQNRPKLWLST